MINDTISEPLFCVIMIEQFIVFNKEGLVFFNKVMSKMKGKPVNELIEVS